MPKDYTYIRTDGAKQREVNVPEHIAKKLHDQLITKKGMTFKEGQDAPPRHDGHRRPEKHHINPATGREIAPPSRTRMR